MTIRGRKQEIKASGQSKSEILSDQRAKIIIENMTARHARILEDFKEGHPHPLPCICWLCLWRKFEKMRPVGPPYDYLTFLAYDILSEIASGFEYYEPVNKIPIKKLAREVVGRLPIISHETKKVLNEFSRELYKAHFVEYAYKGRYRTDKLLNLIEKLIYQIHREWKRSRPEPVATINLKRQTSAALALKIATFVYSQPDRKATQRQLQRHTNKRKADIEALHEWLEWRYGIVVPPHEKWESTLYEGILDRPKSLTGLITLPNRRS
jgi:hypothetical protein